MVMPDTRFTSDVARRGEALYHSRVAPTLEPSDAGKLAFIDVRSGTFILRTDEMEGSRELRDLLPNAQIWVRMVGTETGAIRRYSRRMVR